MNIVFAISAVEPVIKDLVGVFLDKCGTRSIFHQKIPVTVTNFRNKIGDWEKYSMKVMSAKNPENNFYVWKISGKNLPENRLFKQPIVRRLIGDEDIVRVTLGHAGVCDPDELCFFVHLINRF